MALFTLYWLELNSSDVDYLRTVRSMQILALALNSAKGEAPRKMKMRRRSQAKFSNKKLQNDSMGYATPHTVRILSS